MRRLTVATALVGVLTQMACSRAVQVWEVQSSASEIEGIPFYAKVGAVKQVTTYVSRWYRVTMTAALVYEDRDPTKAPHKEVASTQVFDIPIAKRDDLALIKREALAFNADSSPDPLHEVGKLFEKAQTISFLPDTLAVPGQGARANTLEFTVVTDYSRKYYINSGRTMSGTAKVIPELASDGSLTKVEASVESKPADLATAISGLLPVKEALTSLLKLSAGAAVAAVSVKRPVQLNVEVAEVGFIDELTKLFRWDSLPRVYPPLTSSIPLISFARKSYPADTKATDGGKSRIAFEGAIVLPEGKGKEGDGKK